MLHSIFVKKHWIIVYEVWNSGKVMWKLQIIKNEYYYENDVRTNIIKTFSKPFIELFIELFFEYFFEYFELFFEPAPTIPTMMLQMLKVHS